MSQFDADNPLTYIFTWRTHRDAKVCPKCASLDGHVVFYDLFADVLLSDVHGPIWDLNGDHSLAHGIRTFNCRCTLDIKVEVYWSRIRAFQELQGTLEEFNLSFRLKKEEFKLSSSIPEARNEIEMLRSQIQELEREVNRCKTALLDVTALASALGVKDASDIRRMITLVWSLKAAYDAVQIARMSAGDPLAWISALSTAATTAVIIGSEVARQTESAESPQ